MEFFFIFLPKNTTFETLYLFVRINIRLSVNKKKLIFSLAYH